MADRTAVRQTVILLSAILLLAALVVLLVRRGGPYFVRPATIVDHVAPQKHDTRDALLVLPRVRPLLPRGATVTCFHPRNGKWQSDMGSFHAAIAELPHQFVIPPFSAAEDIPKKTLVEYVIALGEPLTHPSYRVIAEFPEGRLYQVMR